MSNVLGIIAEYNPFHNGHLHHLTESKKITNSDYCISIMSGNFTQRGEVSIVDKWEKTKMAIANGVDLVIELPTLYAISSAENFASGAIKILNSLGIVDYISFGSESNDITLLDDIANVFAVEPTQYKTLLSHELSKGESFPKAREKAVLMYLNDVRRFANVLSSPNNILGIEYLKALKKQKSEIQPITIKREESKYNDTAIPLSSRFASATAIRKLCLSTDDITPIQRFVPEASFDILEENIKRGNFVKNLSAFDKEILYTIRKMSTDEIANLPDVSEGLEFSLKNAVNECNSVVELLSIVKSKRYTQTRLQRILLYAILGITKKDMEMSVNTVPYVRVLGFNDKGQELISQISKKNRKLEIVTSVKKFMDKKSNENLKLMMNKDIWATDVYTLGFEYESKANLDYTHKLVTKRRCFFMKTGKHSANAKHFNKPTNSKEKLNLLKIIFKILILFSIIILLYFIYDMYLKDWPVPISDNNIEVDEKEEEILEVTGKIGIQTSLTVEGAEYLEITGVYIDTDNSGHSKISTKFKNNSDQSYENVSLRLNLLDVDNNEITYLDFKINRIDAKNAAATYATLKQDLSNCVNYSIILKKTK